MRLQPSLAALLLATSVCALLADASGQRKRSKYDAAYYATDPYTGGEEAKMKAAGYVSFGPFPWGDDHSTADIQKMFPELKMLFVETAHFKIALDLPPYKYPRRQKVETRLLEAELETLRGRFPTLKKRLRELDPWLRLHLVALRLEQTWTSFQKLLDVEDSDFPADQGRRQIAHKPGQRYMGQGPFLGMRGKILIMVTTKGSKLARYVARAKGGVTASSDPQPVRHYFEERGSLFFGTCCEVGKNSIYNDHNMRCHLLFIAIHSMVDGYKEFYFELPVWLREGLANWHVIQVDPGKYNFTGMKGRSNKERYGEKWAQRMRKRVGFEDFTPAAELFQFTSFDQLSFGDHLAAWSRIDFLLAQDRKKFARFMDLLKNPIPVDPGKTPSPTKVQERQLAALKEAYGYTPAALDSAWTAWVKKTYPRR